jgi:pimeloyl-ACP methyl ester carboxylesterase
MIVQTVDNRDMYYQLRGNGQEVMFVHGAWPSHFDSLVELLATDVRCITFDRLGFRHSSKLNQNTTIQEQADAINVVHDSATSDASWVFGHSSGGNFALAYAVRYPERVKGLILVEPALYAIFPSGTRSEVMQMKVNALPLIHEGQLSAGFDVFLEVLFGPQDAEWHKTDEELEIIRAFGYDQPVVLDWCPSETEFLQITQPVLILEGTESPAVLREICPLLDDQLPNSALDTLAGQDHMMPSGAPNLVAESIMNFILRQESS